MSDSLLNTPLDCQIICTRVVKANQTKAFQAWSNPEHLKNWWGPAGFTNTFHEFDFRVGGKWSFTMHGPEKGNYKNECEFITIKEPEMIAWKRYSQPLFKVLTTFERINDSETKVVFRQIFDTPEECSKLAKFVVDKNEENFDRLESELLKMN